MILRIIWYDHFLSLNPSRHIHIGAYTPGCSKSHLPSFITAQDELKSKGVEMTLCLATNDAYVMEVSRYNSHIYLFFISFIILLFMIKHNKNRHGDSLPVELMRVLFSFRIQKLN